MPDSSSTLHEIKISELPVATGVSDTDQLEANQAGTSRSITVGQVKAAAVAAAPVNVFNVQSFGAKGNGITDDTAAIQAACNAAQATGAVVYLPPTGAAYLISNTIALGNGVKLKGSGTTNLVGGSAISTWTTAGTWIQPTHASNAAVRLQGHGSAIEGISFIHNQPVPAGAWTPTTYGYCIWQTASYCTISNIRIINASHGINIDYTSGSGGGTNCWMRDVIVGAFNTRIRTANANDTMYWSDIHCRRVWLSSDTNITTYVRANTIGWDCNYTDNIMVDGIEFFEDAVAIKLTDGTTLGITHSLYNATLNNVLFGLPTVCMQVAATTTTARIWFGMTVTQTGNAFGLTWSDTAFQLGSDNVRIDFTELRVVGAGGKIMDLGNGTNGRLSVSQLIVENYSTVLAGQVAFNIAAGATMTVGVIGNFVRTGGSGVNFSGAGTFQLPVSQDVNGNAFVAGSFAVGSVAPAGQFLRINRTATGATTVYGAILQQTVQPDVTTTYNVISSNPGTAASAFTLVTLNHLNVASVALGAASAVTFQVGVSVGALTGAGSNWAFRGSVAAAAANYNLRMDGTAQNYLAGSLGIGVNPPVNKLDIAGSFGRGAPVTKTADFTLAASENWVINNKTGSSCTVTIPSAAAWPGREFSITNYQAQTVVCANTIIVPIGGGAAGTAILSANAGRWAKLVSDGTNWIIVAGVI